MHRTLAAVPGLLLLPTLLHAQGPADHVVLVSIDGLRPEFVLDASWPAPTLQRGRELGACARGMRSVFPSVTYPAHSTILTGALPARHGIYYNSPFEPEGATGRWYWESDSIRVETLWDAVREAGRTTASLSWPVSVGAPVTWNVPEIWSLDDRVPRMEVVAATVTPAGLLDELEREATGRLVAYGPGGRPSEDAQTFAWWDERTTRMAEYVIGRYRPTLLTVHLVDPDHQQHDHGREAREVVEAVSAADRALGRMQAAARRAGILDRTAFVVVGDHGFVDTSTRIAPNVWLVEAGLRGPGADRGSWRATFHPSGGSAFLHLADASDEAAARAARRVVEGVDPAVRALFQIVERDSLDALGADPRVPFALAAERGVELTGHATGPAVSATHRATHGYLPTLHPDILTGFVAWGAGVRPGGVLPRMDVEDVAPFVAALLGLSFEAPDGVLRPDLLAPEVAGARR
ncbi:MAG: alkaline phosphatase family protein [Gemmatimonadota bacterium]|jgi:hypothetical protein